jgi:hypothetical protein
MPMLDEITCAKGKKVFFSERPIDRREHRRHDLESKHLTVQRWDSKQKAGTDFGQLVDLSSGGVRIHTTQFGIKQDQQIRLHLHLPNYAGISPFVDTSGSAAQPKSEWTGWLTVNRVCNLGGGNYEVAGRLIDMEDLDRGMLGLYLSTQPLAA